MATKKWIDLLDADGNRVATLTPLYREKLNKMVIYLTHFGTFSAEQVSALKALDFRGIKKQSQAGHKILATDTFSPDPTPGEVNKKIGFPADKLQLLKEAYPGLATVDMDYESEIMNFDHGSPNVQQQTTDTATDEDRPNDNPEKSIAAAETNDLQYLGLNKESQRVFSANGGVRYVENNDGELKDPKDSSYDLSELNHDSLLGMIEDFRTNITFDKNAVERYISALSLEDDPTEVENTARYESRRRKAEQLVQDVLSGAIHAELIGKDITNINEIDSVDKLFGRLPIVSTETMHPITAAGTFQFLGAKKPLSESSLLVSGDTTGAVTYTALSMGAGTLRVNTATEIPDERLRNSNDILWSSIDTNSQALDADSTSSLLASYSKHALSTPTVKNDFSYEYSHEIEAVNALNGLNDEGVAVIQFPTTTLTRDRQFINHLNSMFVVDGVARLDARAFNTNDGHLLVTINGKRPVRDASLSYDQSYMNHDSPYEAFEWLRMKGGALKDLTHLAEESESLLIHPDRESLSSIANEISTQNKAASINPLQVSYAPLSRPASDDYPICVPSSLQRATYIAQAKLTKRLRENNYDNVVSYLADKLEYEETFLNNDAVFAPHQLDQLAHQIMLYEEEGRAMIIGSGTGTGKTRLIAASIRYHLLNDAPVYVQGQNTEFFQKVIDELEVIQSLDLVKPFILNHNEKIFDSEGNVLAYGHNSNTAAIAADKGVPDANVIFATVYQTNRGYPNRKKDESFEEYDERCASHKHGMIHRFFDMEAPAIIIDESHTSGGESKSFEETTKLVNKSRCPLFLSGTSIPGLHAINLYKRAFPREMDTAQLELSIRKGGLPMSEAIITALAEDGAYIRTELPDEKVFTLADPSPEIQQSNLDSADNMAVVFDYYTTLTGESQQALTELVESENHDLAQTDKDHRERSPSELGFSSMHFGSKVGHLISSQILIYNTLHTPDLIEKEIKDGRKVVVPMQHSGEQLLYRMMEKNGRSASGEVKLPTLRDMCLELLEDVHKVDRRVGKKIIKVDLLERMPAAKRAKYEEMRDKAVDFINTKIPEIPFSPLDTMREALQERGITSTEISGRDFEVQGIDRDSNIGKMVKASHKAGDAIKDFHDGKSDVIFMTSAGSTGHDMHARKDTPDNRPVTMILGELDNWAVNILQTAGRVDRLNQVEPPRYFVANPGLPAFTRMMENAIKNVAFVSSSTTANAQNNMLKSPHDGEACILSDAGMRAVVQYLTFNPDLANRLYMEKEIEPFVGDTDAEVTYNSQVNISHKFLSRMMMLPPKEALDIINDVSKEADAILKEQRALGIDNSGGVQFLDVKGTITQKTVVQASTDPDNSDHPLLGDVVGYTVQYKRQEKPMSSDDVMALIDVGNERMANDAYYEGKGMDKAESMLNENYHKMMFSVLPDRIRSQLTAEGLASDKKAIEEETYSFLKSMEDKGRTSLAGYMHDAFSWIQDNISSLYPGGVISYTPNMSIHSQNGVIVGVSHPRPGQEHNLQQWSLDIAVPGESQPKQVSLLDVYKSRSGGVFDVELFSDSHLMAVEFDDEVTQTSTHEMIVVSGNLPKAAVMLQNKTGIMSINFTDDQGKVRRGFLLPEKMQLKDLKKLEQPMPNLQVAEDYLRDNPTHSLSSSPKPKNNEDITLARNDSTSFVLQVPRNKRHGGVYHDTKITVKDPISGDSYQSTQLEEITGNPWKQTRHFKSLVVPDESLTDVLEFIQSKLSSSANELLYGGAYSNEWLNKYFQSEKDQNAALSAERLSSENTALDVNSVDNSSSNGVVTGNSAENSDDNDLDDYPNYANAR